MSNFSDATRMGEDIIPPIMSVHEDLRSISRNLNTTIRDMQCIKSDIAEIKEILKEKEKQEITKGWFLTF
tara:strand:+ start:228 stop:437 length:210 start_codon:yes stop_codon:yes gene_type:complete